MTQEPEIGERIVSGRRQYRNPPIEEALCEIRFSPDVEWDPTVPGLIYQKLRSDYPAKPRSESVVEARGRLSQSEGDDGLEFQLRQNANRVQFCSNDEKRIVRVGPSVLSAHVLRPYSSWESFRAQISNALDVYVDVTHPTAISQIGVRYINRIVVPADVVDLNDYFTSPPEPPDSLPQTIRSFLVRVDAMYEGEPVRLVTTFASESADRGQAAFVLDIDVVGKWSDLMPLGQALAIVDNLRMKEREAFESLITDKARCIFDAD